MVIFVEGPQQLQWDAKGMHVSDKLQTKEGYQVLKPCGIKHVPAPAKCCEQPGLFTRPETARLLQLKKPFVSGSSKTYSSDQVAGVSNSLEALWTLGQVV